MGFTGRLGTRQQPLFGRTASRSCFGISSFTVRYGGGFGGVCNTRVHIVGTAEVQVYMLRSK